MHANTQIRRTMFLMPRAGTSNQSWRDVLDEVRKLASRTGTGRTKLLRKLDELDLAMTSEIDTLDDARRRRIVGPRARVRAATYTVEESLRGPALVEIRPGASARPYKVPLPHYRAVAAAVAATPEPQLFAVIKAAASRRLGEELPDYTARVSLRLWSTADLVQHEGARFTRIGTKTEFTRATRETWARLEHEPFQVVAAQS
tara:strand:+ start:12309 stop:12914 length:606 start_codon:yes stop_codon:yes gene_type:complete